MQKTLLRVMMAAVITCSSFFMISWNKQANQSQNEEMFEMNEIIYVPCANNGLGEFVQLSGFVHLTNFANVNNNHYTIVSHINLNGVSGIGQTTGDRYSATANGQLVYTGSFRNGQSTASGATRIRYNAPGQGNAFVSNYAARVTVNANGEVSTEFVKGSDSCE